MTQERWSAVDRYYSDTLGATDASLDAALEASRTAGLPPIQVSATFGKLLHVLALSTRPSRILEVGTLGGYSAIWLARALVPGGRLVTLEIDPRHADVARANLERAGLGDRVDLLVGPALDALPGLKGPFDLSFIDADKASNAYYFAHALRLSRPGAIIVIDNVARGGAVVDAGSTEPAILGTRRALEAVARAERDGLVVASAVQTVGDKGWDGFLTCLVK